MARGSSLRPASRLQVDAFHRLPDIGLELCGLRKVFHARDATEVAHALLWLHSEHCLAFPEPQRAVGLEPGDAAHDLSSIHEGRHSPLDGFLDRGTAIMDHFAKMLEDRARERRAFL